MVNIPGAKTLEAKAGRSGATWTRNEGHHCSQSWVFWVLLYRRQEGFSSDSYFQLRLVQLHNSEVGGLMFPNSRTTRKTSLDFLWEWELLTLVLALKQQQQLQQLSSSYSRHVCRVNTGQFVPASRPSELLSQPR